MQYTDDNILDYVKYNMTNEEVCEYLSTLDMHDLVDITYDALLTQFRDKIELEITSYLDRNGYTDNPKQHLSIEAYLYDT